MYAVEKYVEFEKSRTSVISDRECGREMEEKGAPSFVLARLSRFRLVHCYRDCNLLAANFSPFASVPVNFDRDKFLTESGRYVSADNKYLFVVDWSNART